MWGRANMAAVIFLLEWLCVFSRAEASNAEVTLADAEAETILERAATWLWSQRDKDASWGNDTHRVLLVLRLANLSRDDNVAPPAPLELQLIAKQMELEIVLLLWRHREGFSPVQLARYTLALNAMCMDPRQFHGHDLIGTLQHHDPSTDYDFALTTLAACSAQAHVRKRQMRRLLDIANAAQDHNVVADIGTSDNHSETSLPCETSGNNTSNVDTTLTTGTTAPVLVNVSYTLWVGSNVNETYNLTVTAPKNETFYSVMLLAASMSPHFQFTASEWPNGHYVHTLAGYKEEPMSYHYWLLYRLPSPPEPSSPPGNQLVAPGGVDNLQISEGEHYLFWYKKL